MISMMGYHASPFEFKFPDLHKAKDARFSNGPHNNGGLGLWIDFDPRASYLHNFGKYLYSVEMRVLKDYRVANTTIGSLSRLRDQQDIDEYRDSLLEDGIAVLRIVEGDGSICQAIVINFLEIRVFKLVDPYSIPVPKLNSRSAFVQTIKPA